MNRSLWRALRGALCLWLIAVSGHPSAAQDATPLREDVLARVQRAAVQHGESSVAHWGWELHNYTRWSSHTNRLIPVYIWGTSPQFSLKTYRELQNPYRSADLLEKLYGEVPCDTLHPEAQYFDQTNLFDLQQAAIKAGKKQIFLVIFDGMDWQITRAAAIVRTGRVDYAAGRGRGLFFQDYQSGLSEFGWVVTSPYCDGLPADMDAQKVLPSDGRQLVRGGYDPRRGGPDPWTPGDSSAYPVAHDAQVPCRHAVTDSAAAATSMTTGRKTYNNAINVDPQGRQLTTIAHIAQHQGWAVGAISSVPISHATPAAAYAHNVHRDDYQDISRDLLGLPSISHPEQPLPGMDVVLGGGFGTLKERDAQGKNFVPGNQYLTDEDLLRVDIHGGGRYVVAARTSGRDGRQQLLEAASQAINGNHRLLGFYGVGSVAGHLPYATANGDFHPVEGRTKKAEIYTAADLQENPNLEDMTQAAIAVLANNPRGFWLMVEPGDVDWAAHDNNLDNAIGAVYSGDRAVKMIVEWVERYSSWDDALLIVTADHGHYLVLDRPELLSAASAAEESR